MRPASELAVGTLEAGTPELDSLEAAATVVAAGNSSAGCPAGNLA